MTDFATLLLVADSRGLVQGEQALDRLATTAERTEGRTGKAMTSLGKSTEQVGRQSIFASQQSRLLAMQLSQVGQQASATGNLLQAIAIQLPDMALGFGTLGIVAGVAAGALLSYFATYDQGDDANNVLRDQENLIRQVADRWGEAVPALRAYADELQRARELADLKQGAQFQAESEYEKIRLQLEGFNDEYGRTIELLNSTDGTDRNVMALSVAYEDLETKLKNNTATMADFKKVQEAATKVAASEGYEDITTFAQAFEILRQKAAGALAVIASLRPAMAGTPEIDATLSGIRGLNQPLGYENPFTPDATTDIPTPERRPSELGMYPGGGWNKGRSGRGGKSQATLYDELIEATERRITSLEAERAAVGLTEQAADKLRLTTELMNSADQKGIELTEPRRAKLESMATTMSTLAEQTRQAQEQMDFFEDISNDLKHGFIDAIVEGESLTDVFKSLADSIAKAALEAAFFNTGPFGTGATGGGNILGGVHTLNMRTS